MHQINLQFTEQLYEQAHRRALIAGFASLDEYIVEIVSEDLARESEDLDDRFTPKVVAHLNQIQEEIKAGAKTFSDAEMDVHFRERAQAWRESHAK